MKKHFFRWSLFCVCLSLALLTGCRASNLNDESCTDATHTEEITHTEETTHTEEETNLAPSYTQGVFDKNKTYKPTEQAVQLIEQGMSFYEITEIIGKPHGLVPGMGMSLAYVWETTDGNMYSISFIPTEDAPNNHTSLSEFLRYTVATNKPGLLFSSSQS